MELLYHVDKDDKVLGSIERDKAHATNALHRSGMVYLFNSKGELLIQHRSAEKKTFPSCYDMSCAFHITYGEKTEEAAKRELIEETGVSDVPLTYIGKYSYNLPPENEIVHVFYCTSDKRIMIDPSESTGAEFVDLKEARRIVKEERTTPWFKDSWKMLEDFLLKKSQ